jgi:hypothetical protein
VLTIFLYEGERSRFCKRLYSMKSLRCGGRQFLTLHPAGFDESKYCGGYAGLSHDSGVAPKVANATYL